MSGPGSTRSGTVTVDPRRHDAVLFDLDGVVTDTAVLHAAAWKELFDDYLRDRPQRAEEDHRPFSHEDYRRHVDGMSRYDGVERFLASRGIDLPRGEPSDPPDKETVCGLGNRKNRYFLQRLQRDGVQTFDSTVSLVHRLQTAGVGTAVFSASRNCREVLEAAGLADLFPVRVDGVDADDLGLPGKPDPSVLVEAARRIGVPADRAVVFEDAEAGVEAGRRGGFALVVGVDRAGRPEGLREHGADAVVGDLAEVTVAEGGRRLSEVPDAFDSWSDLVGVVRTRPTAVFVDFDGTLSPVVDDPGAAALVEGTASVLRRLARQCPVAVVSGRDLADVRDRVGVEEIWYAGSHGFELSGPGGDLHGLEEARTARPALHEAADEVERRLATVPGVVVERKAFALAVHHRKVDEDRVDEVLAVVDDVGRRHAGLRLTHGRRVVELRPDLDWDKGAALQWLLERILPAPTALPLYIGDDLTDEDALEALRTTGIGIVVRNPELGDRPTAAHFAVDGPEEVRRLLERLADELADELA